MVKKLNLKIFGNTAIMIYMIISTSSQASELAQPTSSIASHCAATEVDYFSCRIKKSLKVVSLCGKNLDSEASNTNSINFGLEYRFGALSNVELRFPSVSTTETTHFFGEHLQPYGEGVSVDSVMFESGMTSYVLIVREGRNKFKGILVSQGKKHRQLECDSNANTKLFFGLVNSLPQPK